VRLCLHVVAVCVYVCACVYLCIESAVLVLVQVVVSAEDWEEFLCSPDGVVKVPAAWAGVERSACTEYNAVFSCTM